MWVSFFTTNRGLIFSVLHLFFDPFLALYLIDFEAGTVSFPRFPWPFTFFFFQLSFFLLSLFFPFWKDGFFFGFWRPVF